MTESTATINRRQRAMAVLLCTTSLASTCYGFGLAPNHPKFTLRSHSTFSKSSPLFVVESSRDVNGDSKVFPVIKSIDTKIERDLNGDSKVYPVIKSIDAKMAKFEKSRDKYQEKLTRFEQGLKTLQSEKMQYLEGIEMGKPPVGGNFKETTMRSAVKSMIWRLIAGSVTFITSLKFSGSLSTALRIVGSDFFSKALTMFIGERLMNNSQAGRKTGADSAGRSVAKALIWRLFAICNTLTVSCFFAKDLTMASKIAGSDAIFKTGLMVLFERVWARIEWGKDYDSGFII
mmetsp:Transcript_29029/g.34504  ORF Transcript_29029/g.34504 Transcript_29029/m.34504 type:complete len:289 (+) Transcript_29029:59-925(+)